MPTIAYNTHRANKRSGGCAPDPQRRGITGAPNGFRCAALVFLASLLVVSGCGYHLSGTPDTDPNYKWPTLFRGDVSTVAVPIFSNRSFFQGGEFRLTKAIIGQLESQSPYKVVPKERADTILEGEIVSARVHTVSINGSSAVAQEQMYSLVVRFTWRDLRTGKILAKREDFEQGAPFYPTLGEDQFVGQQENIERLAIAIVQQLESEWGTKNSAD